MIRLILMRHGNTFEAGEIPRQVGARTDLPLTSFGRSQGEVMGRYLLQEGISPKVIYAGKLKRQSESAQIIGTALGLKFKEAPALTEIDYGLWEGLPSEEIEAKWPKEYAEWTALGKWQSHIFQGSYEAHLQNIQNWLSDLRNQYAGETVIGITSNGLLRFFKNEKVKTGHFCDLHLLEKGVVISRWNQNPFEQSRIV